MVKVIYLVDYAGNQTRVELEMDGLISATIKVLTGDEILTAVYDDGSIEHYDSSHCRRVDFFDGEYTIYTKDGVNKLKDFEDSNRSDSYALLYG